jgi:hypothetical protein
MTPAVIAWAKRNNVSPAALIELRAIFGMIGGHFLPPTVKGISEAAAQAAVRLEATRKGVRLFRNNVGALVRPDGVPVRFGLANESPEVNRVVKSSDLIGWRPVLIEAHNVGHVIAQFVSRECKVPGWHYTGTEREAAQLAWLQLVASGGGDAAFCTGEGTL